MRILAIAWTGGREGRRSDSTCRRVSTWTGPWVRGRTGENISYTVAWTGGREGRRSDSTCRRVSTWTGPWVRGRTGENISYCPYSNMKFRNFFLFWGQFLACLDPDPEFQCGSSRFADQIESGSGQDVP